MVAYKTFYGFGPFTGLIGADFSLTARTGSYFMVLPLLRVLLEMLLDRHVLDRVIKKMSFWFSNGLCGGMCIKSRICSSS
jgi:hypothetical protein